MVRDFGKGWLFWEQITKELHRNIFTGSLPNYQLVLNACFMRRKEEIVFIFVLLVETAVLVLI